MKAFKNILAPIDLSEASEKLVPYITAMAAKFDARIHLLFVVRVLQHFTSIYVPHTSVNGFEKEIAEGAEKSWRNSKKHTSQGMKRFGPM